MKYGLKALVYMLMIAEIWKEEKSQLDANIHNTAPKVNQQRAAKDCPHMHVFVYACMYRVGRISSSLQHASIISC